MKAVVAAVPLLLAALAGFGAPAQAAEWESREHNVVLRILDIPAPWRWLPARSTWAEHGIIRGADRRLVLRLDGKPVNGEGALLHLARRPVPRGTTLKQLAADKEVQGFLLDRFRGRKPEATTEAIKVVSHTNKDGHPAVVLRTRGTAGNLDGQVGPCSGRMIVTVAKGHVYLLRMYAFPNEGDREGLTLDLEYMEGLDYGLELLDTREPPKPQPRDDAAPPVETGRAVPLADEKHAPCSGGSSASRNRGEASSGSAATRARRCAAACRATGTAGASRRRCGSPGAARTPPISSPWSYRAAVTSAGAPRFEPRWSPWSSAGCPARRGLRAPLCVSY